MRVSEMLQMQPKDYQTRYPSNRRWPETNGFMLAGLAAVGAFARRRERR